MIGGTLTVTDQIMPTLLKIEKNGRGFGLQAMNKGGAKVRSAIEHDTNSAGFHNISQRFVGGKRLLTERKKQLFSRYSKETGAKLPSLGRLTKWKLHPISGVLLVGFIDTKPFKTYSYNGGSLTGTGRSSGAFTKSIADKIINGKIVTATLKQKRFFRASGMKAPSRIKYKAHPTVLKFGKYVSILTSEMDKAFNEALTQAKVA